MKLNIKPTHLFLVLAGWAFAMSASAQWQWTGKDGRKVFSDRPPPADIPEKDILKQPSGRGRANGSAVPVTEATTPTLPVASSAKANAPKLSGKDAALEAKKKKFEEEEAAKKKAEEEKTVQAKADNCALAKKGLATVQSGIRISTINAKGEREYMDDNARTAENKRLQAIADSDCK